MDNEKLDVDWLPLSTGLQLGSTVLEPGAAITVPKDVPGGWAEARQKEFRAGRALAHIVLNRMGQAVPTILRAEDRTPVWPNAVVASISHTRSRIFVAAALRANLVCLGVDAEADCAVTDELHEALFVADKQATIAQGIDPTALFCCKEAVYKAVYTAFREFFDFPDLAVTATATRFRARPLTDLKSASAILAGEGRIIHHKGHVIVCFLVPA